MTDKVNLPTAPPPYTESPAPYPPPPFAAYPAAPGYPVGPQYPQGPGYPPGPGIVQPGSPLPPPTTVIYTAGALGCGPSRSFCPTCQREVLTNVTYESGLLTWILVAVIFFLGGVLGCCLIPFCCDCDKDVVHSCPHCRRSLGKCSRL